MGAQQGPACAMYSEPGRRALGTGSSRAGCTPAPATAITPQNSDTRSRSRWTTSTLAARTCSSAQRRSSPTSRPRPTSWTHQFDLLQRPSSCCSQKALAERRCEARNRSEVIFPPADLSDSDRESLTMVVKDSVPVAKIRSRYAPLQLHRAPADHRLRRMRSEGHRTRSWGCTWAYGRGLGC